MWWKMPRRKRPAVWRFSWLTVARCACDRASIGRRSGRNRRPAGRQPPWLYGDFWWKSDQRIGLLSWCAGQGAFLKTKQLEANQNGGGISIPTDILRDDGGRRLQQISALWPARAFSRLLAARPIGRGHKRLRAAISRPQEYVAFTTTWPTCVSRGLEKENRHIETMPHFTSCCSEKQVAQQTVSVSAHCHKVAAVFLNPLDDLLGRWCAVGKFRIG